MLTAEAFVEMRHELPDGGRWTELVAGELLHYTPPEERHGQVVLTLSKHLAEWLHSSDSAIPGVVCHDLGLQTATEPDTVRFPTLCVFQQEDAFGLLDEVVTSAVPDLIVEVASTNDRRTAVTDQVDEYREIGAPVIWVIDPDAEEVHHVAGRRAKVLGKSDRVSAAPALSDFSVPIDKLLAAPEW